MVGYLLLPYHPFRGSPDAKKRGFKLYWKLFTATFCSPPSPSAEWYVIVPLMKGRFVDDLHRLE